MRSTVAEQQGLDEAQAQRAFGDPDELDPAHAAAVRLADALMTQPGQISDELAGELRHHFTDDQLVELTLDVMKWNYQKVAVATGTDFEFMPGRLAPLAFDEDGHFIRPE